MGASQLQGGRLGKPDDARLGCRIVGLTKVARLSNKGTDVDDLPAFLLREIGKRGFDRVEETVQINLDNGIPIFDSAYSSSSDRC